MKLKCLVGFIEFPLTISICKVVLASSVTGLAITKMSSTACFAESVRMLVGECLYKNQLRREWSSTAEENGGCKRYYSW